MINPLPFLITRPARLIILKRIVRIESRETIRGLGGIRGEEIKGLEQEIEMPGVQVIPIAVFKKISSGLGSINTIFFQPTGSLQVIPQ
jgi:hypothetical protein